jgi:zinc protease
MSKLSVIALTGLLLFACTSQEQSNKIEQKGTLPAGVNLIEHVIATDDRLAIPFKKYILDNGLTVILHKDNSDPLVHVDVTYHVGSAREQLGKSGFAHFFEHMMFQGSKNVADEQHFKIVTQSGGNLNGTTNTDRTNYYETVPKNQLEKMLWLESDLM